MAAPRKQPVPIEAAIEAALDPADAATAQFTEEMRELIRAVATEVRVVLKTGSPDRRDKILQMFAAPLVKATLAPQKQEDTSISDFHTLRREMMGDADDTATDDD